MFETARSKWEAGHQIYISRAKLGAKPWREAAWNWRSETMVAFIGDERITASFQWRSYAEFKDSVSNPDQAFHLQFKETLEMLARVRDKLEREISASAVSSKASLPTVAAS